MITIRKEQPADIDAIRQLHLSAFEDGPEASLVDKLRLSCSEFLSFVALKNETIVGHILFTPATIDGSASIGIGLAPMAVLPSEQKNGIGSKLVRHGLDYLESDGCPFVIVLGHPKYYLRFGFEPASKYNLHSQWEEVPDEAFMAIILNTESIPQSGGISRYRSEFNDAM
ncbi:MAG: N-acetyltransferase [Maribacter sp.]|nr:N-acetyltransferase [Maribacter sp.]